MSSERLNVGDFGDDVARLHENLKKRGLDVSAEEVKRKFFGPATREAVCECQKRYGLEVTGDVNEVTAAALSAKESSDVAVSAFNTVPPVIVSPLGPFSSEAQPTPGPATPGGGTGVDTDKSHVQGRIFFEHGLPAGGVTVRLYSRGFGGAETQLGEVTTDAHGGYVLPYDIGGKAANIEVRAVDSQGKEIPLSATKFNADKHEVLNLVAPATVQPLAPEYQRLTGDLVMQLGDLNILAEAKESAERQDLTLLHQATAWDARLIALTATAVKASADTGIPQDALYALFRAGLPTDQRQLAWVSSQAVEKALGKAKEAGIVSLSDQQIAGAKATFEKFARTTRLAARAPGALSSFGDLLSKAGPSETARLTDTEKNIFADLYFAHRGAAAELWQKARERGIPEVKINGLRLQGKLAYLTLNNANLADSLQREIGSAESLAQLADKDLYSAEAWKTRLNSLANNNEDVLKTMIPPAYAGEKIADRLEAYAADLARRVRLNSPTRVAGRMIEKDELRLGDNHDALKTPVRAFLKNAEGLGFELGRTPLGAFIKQNHELFQGIAADKVKDTIQSVKTVQRLYQITPTDESLKVLFDQGFKSAHDVVAFPYEVFVDRFGPLFPSREEARLVYRKAEQVSVVTYNFLTIAKQLDSAPPLYAMSPPAVVRENTKNELIKHYPTMGSLFGSLDFCECEECRSVLSPAAYFVDLLQFLDRDDLVWKNFLQDWKQKHNGKGYDGPEYRFTKPYAALIERRPDLPHLALTCENTQTALPYIDLVNEILEYYVAFDKPADRAYDTGAATTQELLAEPQNILAAAYGKLKDARYPLTLPFDLWLETVRQFFGHFETPLWQVLATFRPSDELFAPAQPYDGAVIFREYLGISPAEYAIFTDPKPLAKWYELYGYPSEPEALTIATDTDTGQRIDVNSAKALSRRLGVSYKQLVDLVRTGFVNPKLDALVVLRKLELDADDVFRYEKHPKYQAFTAEEQAAFEQRIDDLTKMFNPALDPGGFNAKTWLDTAWQNAEFNQVLVLADPNTGCNFGQTTLRYANGDPADAQVFLKISLFVRLWKRLGWTIEETDRALQVFLPRNALPLTGANIGEALKTALVYLAHLKGLDEMVKVDKNSRLKLLTLWSNLPTTGKNPLYAQFFLTRSMLKNDPVFDDPLGNYLSKAGILIKDHLLALQGALNLTADEIGRIFADAGKDLATAELSLANVSLPYRYGLLAKALKLSVRDLIALKGLSGLDPFKSLKPDPVAALADDYPFMQTLRFVEVAQKIKDSGFQVEDLDYLLRHRFDSVGKYRTGVDVPLALVKSLAAEFRRIQAEHTAPEDPLSLTDDLLRQKMSLVLPPDVMDTFMAMWIGTVEYQAVRDNVLPADKIDPVAFAQEPAVRVVYDVVRQAQRLIFRGILQDTEKTRLKNLLPGSLVLAALLDAVQGQGKAFFEKHLQKSTIGGQSIGFLDAGDFDLFFAPAPDGLTDTLKQSAIRTKREKLALAFVPYLQQRLIRQFVVQTLATSLIAEPALTEALLTNLLNDPSEPGSPLLNAFTIGGESGISAAFFASTDETGVPLDTRTVVATDTMGKPAGANSARFEGYFEVPAAGTYRFFSVFGKKDAEVELRLAHLPDPLLRGKAANDGDEISQFVELKPGVPYRFTLDVRNLGGGDVALLVQGENLPKDSLARLMLYPEAAVERVQRASALLAKTLQFIQGLGLSEREVRHLLTHAADFDNLDLSKLPTHEADDSPAAATTLFGQFLRMADYARLKRDLAGGTDDFVAVFENTRRTHRASADANQTKTALFDDLCQRLADMTRRDVATVRAAAQHLGFTVQSALAGNELRVETPDFSQEKGIWRLWEVLQVVEKLGAPVEAIAHWAEIVGMTNTPEERFDIARDLRNTVKAHYEPENWQRIAQPIFDKLRQRSRDALVAYVMQRHGFERMEQLFEYFLIDTEMESIVQTSRIRLAISSVQLFIQRCLLNLERQVHPSVINSKHWQWMKRYRVWEANRKIFLFPENWLEPEFRDDKTPLFQELESALLQGDVSNDLAEDAFFNYLKKLEELARLDIVAMYCEEKPLDPASNTLHVIGRTFNLPHKYFYRRYAHQMWTPWEPVTAEIEGDHIVAVVWRERLHLFWVTFLEKAEPNTTMAATIPKEATVAQVAQAVSKAAPVKKVEVQLNWSEYFQGEWTTRESSGFDNPIRAEVDSNFDRNKVFIHVSKEYEEGEERAVNIHLSGALDSIYYLILLNEIIVVRSPRAFRVVSKNSQPEPGFGQSPQEPPYSKSSVKATRYTGSGLLKVTFAEKIETEDGKPPEPTQVSEDILRQGGNFSLLTCADPSGLVTAEIGALVSPFFYQDNQHTFFVEPSLTETTIEQWETWVVPTPLPDPKLDDDDWWKNIPIEPMVPAQPFPIDPIGPIARFKVQPKEDWVINPVTVFQFDGRLVGQGGRLDVAALPGTIGVGEVAGGGVLVASGGNGAMQGNLTVNVGGLNVVGGGGLNSVMRENLNVGRGQNLDFPSGGVVGRSFNR